MLRTLLLFLALSPSPASAATQISWQDLVKASLQANPELQSAAKNLEASEADYKASFSGFMPSANLSDQINRSYTKTYTQKSNQYGLDAKWNLFQGFGTLANLAISRASKDAAEADRLSKSMELRYLLKQVYYKTLLDMEKIALATQILKRQQENARFIELKYNSGTEAKWNVLTTKTDAQLAEYNLNTAKIALTNDLEDLEKITGLRNLHESELQNHLEVQMNFEPKFELELHPAYLKLLASLHRAENTKLLSKSNFYPSINANFSWNKEKIEASSQTEQHSYSITMNLNIFNGLSDFYSVQKANASLSSIEYEKENQMNSLTQNYRKSLREYKLSLQNIPLMQAQLAAAQERVRTVNARYRNGIASYLDWEQAQSILTNAEQAAVNAKQQALLNHAALENAIGYTLETL